MADASTSTAAAASQDVQQTLQAQLSALQQQFQLKQEEVVLLQAQVERLSGMLDANSDAQVQRPYEADVQMQQQQLEATRAELQHTQSLLEQVMQEGDAAVKAACEQRFGALRLLLAEHVKALQQAEQERAEAQQLAADKTEDCEAMRTALAAANTHILVLTAAQQDAQHTDPSSAGAQQLQEPPGGDTAARVQHHHAIISRCSSHAGSSSSCKQQEQAQELQHQLAVQKQQLHVAHEQIRELLQHLALQRDCADFERRRAALLQQQLEDTSQQLASASAVSAAPPDPQCQRSCSSSAPDSASGIGSDDHNTNQQQPAPCMPQQQQFPSQPQQQTAVEQYSKPLGIAGSFSASLSSAISLTGPKADERESLPPRQQSLQPLSPFTLARHFVAGREAEALTRLKDELREQEQEVSALAAANSRCEVQLEGLQTVLVAKVAQCSRLEREVKELSKQLRQAQAAAASDQAAMGQQLSQLSDRVAELQAALAAGKQREQQLEAQLGATRAKLAQVLEALVDEATALQQHRPAHYKLLSTDMPAARADVLATTAAAAATASFSGAYSSHEHSSTARAASVPLDGQDGHAGLRLLWQPSEGAASRKAGTQQQQGMRQSAGAAASDDLGRHYGLRSFMRSQTLSSQGGSARSSSNGRGGGGGPADNTGNCVTAGVHVQPIRPSGHMVLGPGALAAAAEAGAGAQQQAAVTPKQTAAGKLMDVLKLLKKGKEQEQGAVGAAAGPAAVGSASRVPTGSEDYVLYDELLEDECGHSGTSCTGGV